MYKACCILLMLLMLSTGCHDEKFMPKPVAYHRLLIPDHQYQFIQQNCPYTFEINKAARLIKTFDSINNPCWINIEYPTLKATVHITYKAVNNADDLQKAFKDTEKMTMKHTVKASGITESAIYKPESKVYGQWFDVKGNSASPIQFWVTDSNKHFLRGAVYFFSEPNQDSLAPLNAFIKKDVEQLISTFKWR